MACRSDAHWQKLPVREAHISLIFLAGESTSYKQRLRMTIINNRRTAVLALTIAGLLGAAGCGDSPTGVPEREPVARDQQQVCVIIEGVRYCTGLVPVTRGDTTRP